MWNFALNYVPSRLFLLLRVHLLQIVAISPANSSSLPSNVRSCRLSGIIITRRYMFQIYTFRAVKLSTKLILGAFCTIFTFSHLSFPGYWRCKLGTRSFRTWYIRLSRFHMFFPSRHRYTLFLTLSFLFIPQSFPSWLLFIKRLIMGHHLKYIGYFGCTGRPVHG